MSLTGPDSARAVCREASFAWCKSLARRTAGNFYFSFLTLPSDRFRDMCVLYAFMRVSDDLGDDAAVPVAERAIRLEAWSEALRDALGEESPRCEAGETQRPGGLRDCPPLPPGPAPFPAGEVFPALVDVVRRHRVPAEHLFAVIDGVRMDLTPSGFETFEELSRYCYSVAGAVGLCCIHIWGFHDPRAPERAVDCGTAFQLTNILRDLGEDAAMGRVYLPREDLRRFGYTPEDIASHRRDERFARLMQFEVERAWSYYRRAEDLAEYLDPPGRPIYRAMLRIYGGLLSEIERRRYDVYNRRVTLPVWRKLLIAAEAVVRHRWLRW